MYSKLFFENDPFKTLEAIFAQNILTEKELNEIEEYRDENGNFNLTKVKDFNKLKHLIKIVDKINNIDSFDNDLEDLEFNEILKTIEECKTNEEIKEKLISNHGFNKIDVEIKTPSKKEVINFNDENTDKNCKKEIEIKYVYNDKNLSDEDEIEFFLEKDECDDFIDEKEKESHDLSNKKVNDNESVEDLKTLDDIIRSVQLDYGLNYAECQNNIHKFFVENKEKWGKNFDMCYNEDEFKKLFGKEKNNERLRLGGALNYIGKSCDYDKFNDTTCKLMSKDGINKIDKFCDEYKKHDIRYNFEKELKKKYEENCSCKTKSCDCKKEYFKVFKGHNNINPLLVHAISEVVKLKHFPNMELLGVTSDPQRIQHIIYIPNEWHKIDDFTATLFDFKKDGSNYYIINPETFELEKIENKEMLEKYLMSPLQKECTKFN